MISIRILFALLCSIMVSLLLILGILLYQLNHQSRAIDADISAAMQQIMLAQELRQSSEHLTKFARAYAATGNPKWKQLFDRVLAVRNGFAPLPPGHHFAYWDKAATPGEILLQLGSQQKRHPSLLERMAAAGITDAELSQLRQALLLSDNLVNLERQAFDAIEGVNRTEKGINKITADPELARALLFSNGYFQEKGKIMTPIAQFYQAVYQRSQQQLQQSQMAIRQVYLWQLTILLTLAGVLAGTFVLLWRRYLAPATRLQQCLVQQVTQHNYDFQLEEQHQGGLTKLARAQNQILREVRAQLQRNTSVKEFADVMRDSNSAASFGLHIIDFIAGRFQLPLLGLYSYRAEGLERVAGFGYGQHSAQQLFATDQVQLQQLQTRRHIALTQLQQHYRIPLLSGELTLDELHFFPLRVNEQVIGLLELGTVGPLSSDTLLWLKSVRSDLAINFELTRNSERQANAERQITEQLEFNQQVINAIPSPMYYRDNQGRYIGVNTGFSDFLGLFETDILETTPAEHFPADIAAIFTNTEHALLSSPGSTEYELTLHNANGQLRHIRVYEATYYSSQGEPKGIVGLFVDASEQKALELELRAAKQAADDASEAKGRFLANMSHEIRTPMNAIIGMAHLAMHSDLSAPQRHYVSKIDNAAKSLLGILNDILDFSKVEAGKLTLEAIPFQLEEVLTSLSDVVGIRAAEKDLALLFDIDPLMPSGLIGDPLRLGQILINLCGNGIKFTESGQVSVTVQQRSRSTDHVELEFTIADTGIGMTQVQQQQLFQSFSQADGSITRRYGGTGLGLTISKSLIELMAGEIRVNSSPEQGTEFSFILPLTLQQQTPICPPQPALAKKRLLLVEEHSNTAQVMAKQLRAMGCQVEIATSGFTALTAITQADADTGIDAMLISRQLSGMDGIETTRQLQDKLLQHKPKAILICDGHRDIGLTGDCETLFASNLLKPVLPSMLYHALLQAFSLPLPASEQPALVADTAQDMTAVLAQSRILLVEDNDTNQEVASGILAPYGADIICARHGKAALEILAQQHVDLILMDIQMPVMDGITATKLIRQDPAYQQLPILAMTANAMEQDIEQCQACGMDDHIAKPIDVAALITKVSHWLHNGRTTVHPAEPTAVTMQKKRAKESSDGAVSSDSQPVLDTADGIARLGGNSPLYWQIVRSFLNSRRLELPAITQALVKADYTALRLAGHSLKGAAANIAAEPLMTLGHQLEQYGHNGQLPPNDIIPRLTALLRQIEQALPPDTPHQAEVALTVRAYDSAEFLMELQQLGMLLQQADNQAGDFISLLKQNAEAVDQMGIDFSQVEQALAENDFATAHDALNQLIHQSKAAG